MAASILEEQFDQKHIFFCCLINVFFMDKGFRMFYNMSSVFLLPLVPLGGGGGCHQGSIMSHGMIHLETWCGMQSNTSIVIYGYPSKQRSVV
jgi:hypothetical protein